MIDFDKFTLENGLRVIVHRDTSTPLAAVNVLYDVGARDERPDKTGFAHLFEHLMFGGSINIPNYDAPLQMVGGDNNAFTNNDITNYYLTLPAINLETAFWLESDRMLSLAFSEKSLEVQRNVVIEEFRQRYLNQPYGEVWHKIRELAYKQHPYQWPTIGKEISHIENATMEDVKSFFFTHYRPNNAVLSVAGNVTTERVKELAEKWFGPIEPGEKRQRQLPQEPSQKEFRSKKDSGNVPHDAIYLAFHMPDRRSAKYHSYDLLSDIMSRGKSARLYQSLIKQKKLFSNVNAYIAGSFDPGLFYITGDLRQDVKMEDAENAIWEEVERIKSNPVEEDELKKVQNKAEASHVFTEMEVSNKALTLAYFETLSDAGEVNKEVDKYLEVTAADIQNTAQNSLVKENCSTLYYYSKQ